MALQAPTVPYEPETPFEGTLLPEPPAQEAPAAFEGFTTRTEVATPFLTEYWLGEDSTAISPATSELVDLVEELWDHEFDELTYRLTQEAAAAADDRFPQGEEPGDPTARERFLEGYLEPLHSAAERLFETVAEAVSEHDLMAMSESELDSVLGSLEVGETDLSPTFEGFLGGLLKKAKTLAKGAWSLAKKGISAAGRLLPIGALLSKLKALVRPLLQRVLRFALGKLPPSLRPAASQLAKRILPTIGMGELDSEELEEPTTADVRVIQQELDLGAAALLLAADETEGEVALAEVAMEAANGDGEALARLDHARQRFTEEITQLPEGEDPTQAVENFLPAILPLVKTGIGLIGRPRVVNFLARYLATLIQRYVGRENSAPLSRAIVDAGLRMISLEAPPEVERQAAGAALAATLENTVRHVAELDEMFFEDEDLLAHETYRGFESAAAGNMPPATLRRALRPTAGLDGTWVLMPADSPAKGYKKYSRVLDTEITPQIARELETFGGTALDTFLRERDGDRDTVAARAHLYEAVPGTSLQRLTRLERDVPGLGPAGSTEPPVIHPLSTHAAGLLFREPGLGRDVSTAYLSDPDQIAVGQRLVLSRAGGSPAALADASTAKSGTCHGRPARWPRDPPRPLLQRSSGPASRR